MKIPGAVKIGGLTYVVSETKNITLGANYNAEILYRDLKINLRPMAKEQKERAFLHEALHGIYDNLGYTEHDEKQIDELAGTFYALIADNPEMFGDIE
jgi:hypothetical protein